MTPRVWIERPIESVEDAEGLPDGALVIGPGYAPIDKWEDEDGIHYGTGVLECEPADLVGHTALVPVEAEEQVGKRWRPGDQPERAEEFTLRPGDPLPDWIDAIPTQRRLVTRWEET